MTTQEVADRFYALIQAHQRDQLVDELYGADIVNREPEQSGMPVTTGLDAVRAKSKARTAMIETVHGETCSVPVVGGRYFSVALGRDITLKGKPRMNLQEIGVYEVKDGKIVSEQFFY